MSKAVEWLRVYVEHHQVTLLNRGGRVWELGTSIKRTEDRVELNRSFSGRRFMVEWFKGARRHGSKRLDGIGEWMIGHCSATKTPMKAAEQQLANRRANLFLLLDTHGFSRSNVHELDADSSVSGRDDDTSWWYFDTDSFSRREDLPNDSFRIRAPLWAINIVDDEGAEQVSSVHVNLRIEEKKWDEFYDDLLSALGVRL